MTWEEQYGIYVSNVDIINGAQLTQMSASPFPAIDGKVYTMTPAGNITGPTDGGTPNAYTLVNKYDNLPKGYLTVGLYQNATVDGRATNGNAVSAAQVLYNSTATMTPYSTVYLWTQSQVKSNTVVTNVTSVMTQVNLGGSITTASLRYDASTGKFVETGKALSLPSGGPLLEHILPKLAA